MSLSTIFAGNLLGKRLFRKGAQLGTRGETCRAYVSTDRLEPFCIENWPPKPREDLDIPNVREARLGVTAGVARYDDFIPAYVACTSMQP